MLKQNELAVKKVRMDQIVRKKWKLDTIKDVVRRMNILSAHTYQFVRLWLLEADEIPPITKDLFKMAFKTLAETTTRGRKPEGGNGRLYAQFNKFYSNTYSKLGYENKIDPINLSGIADYAFTGMVTAVENNIKSHYHDYVRRFVNKSFVSEINRVCEKIQDKEKKSELRKQLKKELSKVKNDLFEGTFESDAKFHDWIRVHRQHVIPPDYEFEKIYNTPQIFLPCMKYIVRQLETLEVKLPQFFPLRSSLIPKHITLDTKALIELFAPEGTKGKRLSKVRNNRNQVWGEIFRMNNKAFRRNNYTFKYMITTNGYDASILFAENNRFSADEEKSIKRVQASNEAKALYKGKSPEEKAILKKQREDRKKQEQKEQRKLKKQEREEKKDEKIPDEFPYLEDLSPHEMKDVETTTHGIIDMGKIRIITMLNPANDTLFKYSQKEHLYRTKRLQFALKVRKLKNRLNIPKEESLLSNLNGKTCNTEKFKTYINERNHVLNSLVDKYSDKRFLKWKFHAYSNKNRAYDTLTNHIHTFLITGNNEKRNHTYLPTSQPIPSLIIGDWSAKSTLKHSVSTPGIGLKRRLARRFKIYSLDEYRSSKLHYKSEKPVKNLTVIKNGKSCKIHSVLTYTMENGQTEYINRDRNAVYNMKKFTKHIFRYGTYPLPYRRGYGPAEDRKD